MRVWRRRERRSLWRSLWTSTSRGARVLALEGPLVRSLEATHTRVAEVAVHLEQHDLPQRGQLHAGLGGAHSSQLLDRDHRVRVQLDRLGHHAERALAELAALVLAQLSVARGRPAQRVARCGWVGGMRARAQRGAAVSRRRRTWHVDARGFRRARPSRAREPGGREVALVPLHRAAREPSSYLKH